MSAEALTIIGAADIQAALRDSEQSVMAAVKGAYETHARGASSLPHSSFLRFPDSDADRVICLPAYLGEEHQLAGVKWIASMPGNLSLGIERASAVVILNDRLTGRPEAIMEGSIISKHRTAASAALASSVLAAGEPDAIGFVGCGPINAAVAQYLAVAWPEVKRFLAFDLDRARADAFADELQLGLPGVACRSVPGIEDLLCQCPMVSFGTTAIAPHLDDLAACPAGATLLHVSLRDLSAAAILANHNVVDDLDHVNRAGTSIHLASQKAGNTNFVSASLGELLLGRASLPARDQHKVIFSPFGLGVLDLAVAELVRRRVLAEGGGTRIDSFLP